MNLIRQAQQSSETPIMLKDTLVDIVHRWISSVRGESSHTDFRAPEEESEILVKVGEKEAVVNPDKLKTLWGRVGKRRTIGSRSCRI